MASLKGNYLLILYLEQDLQHLRVGRLGHFDFASGYYLYVGSAFGSGGLAARIGYHQQPHKPRPHWHIDYLRPHTRLIEAWTVASPMHLESLWCARLTAIADIQTPVRGFGASDTGCFTHLFYLPCRPRPFLLTHILLHHLPLTTTELPEFTMEIHVFEDS